MLAGKGNVLSTVHIPCSSNRRSTFTLCSQVGTPNGIPQCIRKMREPRFVQERVGHTETGHHETQWLGKVFFRGHDQVCSLCTIALCRLLTLSRLLLAVLRVASARHSRKLRFCSQSHDPQPLRYSHADLAHMSFAASQSSVLVWLWLWAARWSFSVSAIPIKHSPYVTRTVGLWFIPCVCASRRSSETRESKAAGTSR